MKISKSFVEYAVSRPKDMVVERPQRYSGLSFRVISTVSLINGEVIRGRKRQALGYRPPNEFEEAVLKQGNTGKPRQILLTLSVQS